jgi:mRNA-degrading endonuclease RelE of RelBE toxin-antitoxin system
MYTIKLDEFALENLRAIPSKAHSSLKEAILEQLTHQPTTVTRNRKPLDPKILNAAWELRCGPQNTFRVLYEVLEEEQQVNILVIGIKQGERLLVNGRELE